MSASLGGFWNNVKDFFSVPEIKTMGEDYLRDLRRELDRQCPPRIILVGKTGGGKSSIINALFGERVCDVDINPATTRAVGMPLQRAGRRIEIYDTVGLDDATRDNGATMVIVNEHVARCDLVVFVIDGSSKAYESDRQILGRLDVGGKPLLIVVNKLDMLEPTRTWSPPYDENDAASVGKAGNIARKMAWVRNDLLAALQTEVKPIVLPLAVPEGEVGWNVDRLAEQVFSILPDHLRLDYVRALPHTPSKVRVCTR